MLYFLVGEQMGASWKDNKQECLEMAAKLMRDSDTNVTIVGTQKVVDAEGNILHVNRIELLVPTLVSLTII